MPLRYLPSRYAGSLLACIALIPGPVFAEGEGPDRPFQLAQDGGGPQGKVVVRYGSWGVAVGEMSGKICYTVSTPIGAPPPVSGRNRSYLMIATRPAKNQTNEISVASARRFKPGARAFAAFGSRQFELFTKDDGAWIKNTAEEPLALEAMLLNAEMVIAGTAMDGGTIRERYRLDGLAKAIERVAQECR
jgi:hypothetical protein